MPEPYAKSRPIRFRLFLTVALTISLFWTSACSKDDAPVIIDLSKRVPTESLEAQNQGSDFHIGIGSRITPKEGYVYYRQLIQYLGEHLDLPIKVIDRGTYEEINSLLENQQLDAAFVCGGPYVAGKDGFGLELLVQPVVDNGTVYHSFLIVPADSPVRTLEDLRGKTFAFTDPKSNSGYIAPTYWLKMMGETTDTFFAKHIFTYAHDASIIAVMDKLVDGAAVDSLIWEYMNNNNPEVGVKTRIIMRSEEFGIPPLVIRPGLPPETKAQLRDLLLEMHNDPAGKKILDGMRIKRFVIGKDSDYNSIRRMRDFISRTSENSQ